MKKILLSTIICLGILSIIGIHQSYESTTAKILICNNDATLCPNTNITMAIPIVTTGIVATIIDLGANADWYNNTLQIRIQNWEQLTAQKQALVTAWLTGKGYDFDHDDV